MQKTDSRDDRIPAPFRKSQRQPEFGEWGRPGVSCMMRFPVSLPEAV